MNLTKSLLFIVLYSFLLKRKCLSDNYNFISNFFQYKDAFLNANPDFKWYKLPAPPLRTLNTRPTNKKAETNPNEQLVESVKSENKSSDYSKSDKRDGQSIQPGKLADESQIGGLSSLFTPQKTQAADEQVTVNDSVIENDTEVPKPPKKRYLEIPFSPDNKRECKADLFDAKKRRKSESNNNVHQCVSNLFNQVF